MQARRMRIVAGLLVLTMLGAFFGSSAFAQVVVNVQAKMCH